MKLQHVMDVRSNPGNHSKYYLVHAQNLQGNGALCQHFPRWKDMDGTKVDMHVSTNRPLTCKSCIRAVEMALRDVIHTLNATDMEKVMQYVQKELRT